MKPDILSKLAAELREKISSERQVVYIMVELRKLIELNGDGAQYAAFKFHCDWIAHPLLTGTQARHIVRLFDRYQQLTDHPSSGQAHPDMSFMGQLGPVMTMSNLRNELNAFLHTQGLDNSVADEEVNDYRLKPVELSSD